MKEKAKRIIAILIAIALILIAFMIRQYIVGEDDFRRDVASTYIKSVFTDHRYSVNLLIHIPIAYFLLISTLIHYIVKIDSKVMKLSFWIVNLFSFLYIVALGVLYTKRFAYENIQHGEYLTNFENYMLIPVIMTLLYWTAVWGYILIKKRKNIS